MFNHKNTSTNTDEAMALVSRGLFQAAKSVDGRAKAASKSNQPETEAASREALKLVKSVEQAVTEAQTFTPTPATPSDSKAPVLRPGS